AGVELAQERREDLAGARARDAIEEEGLASHQPALADEEELDAGVCALPDDAYDVLVRLLGGDDLLPLAHRVERLDLVPQAGGPLELHLAGCRLHLTGQIHGEIIVLAVQEALHLVDCPGVSLARLPARAGGMAAVNVVLQAWARQRAVDLDPAGPEREQ